MDHRPKIPRSFLSFPFLTFILETCAGHAENSTDPAFRHVMLRSFPSYLSSQAVLMAIKSASTLQNSLLSSPHSSLLSSTSIFIPSTSHPQFFAVPCSPLIHCHSLDRSLLGWLLSTHPFATCLSQPSTSRLETLSSTCSLPLQPPASLQHCCSPLPLQAPLPLPLATRPLLASPLVSRTASLGSAVTDRYCPASPSQASVLV